MIIAIRPPRTKRLEEENLLQYRLNSIVSCGGVIDVSRILLWVDNTYLFQSTPPYGGDQRDKMYVKFPISIHSPCVGRDAGLILPLFFLLIPIHSPRVGRDSTASRFMKRGIRISIHSPCVGRDSTRRSVISSQFQSTLHMRGETVQRCSHCCICPHFNPLSPCGERLLHGQS